MPLPFELCIAVAYPEKPLRPKAEATGVYLLLVRNLKDLRKPWEKYQVVFGSELSASVHESA